jgi:membrane fusion protein (multidrug efflux system)
VMNKRQWSAVAAGVLVLAVAAGGAGWWFQALADKPAGQGDSKDTSASKDSKDAKAGKDGKGEPKAEPQPPEKPLEFGAHELTQPVQAMLSDSIPLAGPLVAPSSAVVRARVGGRLTSLRVVEGQRVRAGEVLGQIEMADLGSRVAERSALVDAAQSSLSQAERAHAQNERLAAQSFISGSALDTSRAAVQAAKAQVDAAQAALATTRSAARDANVVAPIAGIVAKRQALPGEMVSAEQTLFTLVDLAKLEVAGTVGTHEVSRLSVGMPVAVRIEGHPAAVQGRLVRIAPAAEPGTRAIGVTVGLDNPKEQFRAGQYATATVTLADAVPRWVIPLAAVGSTSGQNHVWTLHDGRLQRRAVTLGRRDEASGRVEVLDGLPSGARILAARFDNLREGAPATVVAQRAAP